METEKTPKNPTIFICEKCDFKSSNKKDYKRHLGTAKHKWKQMETFGTKKTYECVCGKEYNTRSGLFKHKKKCNYKTPEEIKEEQFIEYIEEQRIRQEKHLEEQKIRDEELKQQIAGMSLVTNNHNTINNNNNIINLKLFLNNDCKDAMGMTEFLNSIRVSEEDLITFVEEGYVKGITRVIERHLSELEITERPIHCTDKKRQTIYFNSEKEGWKKDEEIIQLDRMINTVENKSYYKFLDAHKEKGNPEDTWNPESPRHKWYITLALETAGGAQGSKDMNIGKIGRIAVEMLYVKVKKEIVKYN